jgi:hypothetical protein
LDELSAGERIFLAIRVAIASEYLPATHVVVAIATAVGVLL